MATPSRTLVASLVPSEAPTSPAAAVRLLFFNQLHRLSRHTETRRFGRTIEEQLASVTLDLRELSELHQHPLPESSERVANLCADAANYLAFYLTSFLARSEPLPPRPDARDPSAVVSDEHDESRTES